MEEDLGEEGESSPLGICTAWFKSDSRGEWSLDEVLEEQAEGLGIPFYPKLILASPFTPLPCHKLLGPTANLVPWSDILERTAQEVEAQHLHALFIPESEQFLFEQAGWYSQCEIGWRWPNPGYLDFEDFLRTLPHQRRKEIKRERAKAAALGLEFRVLESADLSPVLMEEIFNLIEDTHGRHSSEPYLNREFFQLLPSRMPNNVLVFTAWDGEKLMAISFCFHKGGALYGRYWGSWRREPFLYFELTFYQLMEEVIRRKWNWLDTGWGGSHKRWRGFKPVLNHSAHKFFHPGLQDFMRKWSKNQEKKVLNLYNSLNQPGGNDL